MPAHKYVFVPTRDLWPAASVNSRLPPVPLTKADGSPVLDKKGKQIKLPANLWLDQNQPVEQMTWAPGEPLIRDKLVADGGWIERPGARSFNLYRPPPLITGNAAEADPWLDHVRKSIPMMPSTSSAGWRTGCSGRTKRSITPGARRHPRDRQGQLARPGQARGRPVEFPGGIAAADARPLQRVPESVILRISEARDLGEFDRFKFYEHMKAYTAARPTCCASTRSTCASTTSFNCCGLVDHHQPPGRRHLPAGRRSPPLRGLVAAYQGGLCRRLLDHAVGLVRGAADSTSPPICGESILPASMPRRRRRRPGVLGSGRAGRTPEDAELADVLDAIGEPEVKEKDRDAVSQPNVVTIAAMIHHAAQNAKHLEFADWLRDRKNRRNIPHRMEACGYVAVHNPAAKDGLWKIKGRRVVVYGKVGLRAEDQIRMLKEEWRRSVYDEMERTVDRLNGYSNYGSNYDDR